MLFGIIKVYKLLYVRVDDLHVPQETIMGMLLNPWAALTSGLMDSESIANTICTCQERLVIPQPTF